MFLPILVNILTLIPISVSERHEDYDSQWNLQDGRLNVEKKIWYSKQKYHVKCGFWKWGRCTRYRHVYHYKLYCKSGWSNDRYYPDCKFAVCDGKIRTAACNQYYPNDKIVRRNDTQQHSGGECKSPNHCTGCNDGFYSDGLNCRICPKIAHCNHRRCSKVDNTYCEWCEGEIKPKQFHRAYTRYPSNTNKTCKKACSWRADSTRCFPGTCAEELAEKCTCWNGFGGPQCSDIHKDVNVLYAEAKLEDSSHKIIKTPIDPNDPSTQPIRWTNNVGWKIAEIEFRSKFPNLDGRPLHDPTGENHFVTDFKYGIISASMTLRQEGGFNQHKSFNCYSNENAPLQSAECARTKAAKRVTEVDISTWQFQHDHKLIFEWTIRSGGYLVYLDRDKNSRPIRVSLNGKTLSRSYKFQWDMIKPYHRCIKDPSICNDPPITTTDVTELANNYVMWTGWIDDLSKVEHYQYQVYELATDGTQLTHELSIVASNDNISDSTSQEAVTVSSPGMYSVVFAVYDKAGNYKTTRSLIFYDNESKVEIKPNTRAIVQQSSKETNRTWISENGKTLHVTWENRFLNERHKKHNWLQAVAHLPFVEDKYDDHYGTRTINAVPNAHGIVRFEIKYQVFAPSLADQKPFTKTTNVETQSGKVDVTWDDGNRLDITVRAFDIFEKFAEDTIIVYKDTSPPQIDNLWLSRGDQVNISVHNVEEFTEMIIEWKAIDLDSGLDQVRWRLFDNFTGAIIDHGIAHLHAQGMAENLTVCKAKYRTEPRGPSCYCTMFHGCYHNHFYVKPYINKDAGLIPGKDKGVHDSDYYIEVTVINNALLETTFIKKITIDVSPPHEGAVHDGLKGEPEVDYQQDFHIDAHWEGFFDRESGVEYYQYVFSEKCLNNNDFQNSTMAMKTYNTFASYDAPKEGTYYISLVAVNRAWEASNVVCSDGVTIMKTVPFINDFVLDGAHTRSRLFKDTDGSIWLLDKELKRHAVKKSTTSCGAVTNANVTIFPEGHNVSSISRDLCSSTPLHILAVVSKSSQIKLSWSSGIDYSLIHDFEVGLSSTNSGFAPDIFPFRSSKHHLHFRINHPDVPDGKEFYVVIKSISKSGVTGIQSIGPFIVDTTKPQFSSGKIDVRLDNKFLIANWSSGVFTDPDDPNPMEFQFAFGHEGNVYDIQPFRNLQFGGSCIPSIPATCTSMAISHLKWHLHGHHSYVFTIKATNLAGLYTTQKSERYIHDVQLPSKGTVFDVYPTNMNEHSKDIVDIDFTADKTELAIIWSGFIHPHQSVAFSVCIGTYPDVCDVVSLVPINTTDNRHVFRSLNLQYFQTYYCTIKARTTAGTVSVSSDGVQILDLTRNLTEVTVRDGTNCSSPKEMKKSHHQKDTRPTCSEDIDFQTSTTSLHSYWHIPKNYKSFIGDSFVKVEERLIGDVWMPYIDFTYIGKHQYATINDLSLEPGKSYRTVVKFCADDLCFPFVYSNGITVLNNPPITGNISTKLQNTTDSKQQLIVTFKRMRDPDIKDPQEAMDVVNEYEWALGDHVGIHTIWKTVENATMIGDNIKFTIPLNSSLDFSKCRKLSIRGYNKAGVWSTASKEILKCNIHDGNSLITPNIVIDAIGKQERSLDGTIRDGYGHEIFLEENARWDNPDADYTPYKNIISATWPLLRHKNYTWAVLDGKNLDETSFYKDDSKLHLQDPCSHPDAIKCGHTEKEFLNVIFNTKEKLEHGKRYLTCIHAPRTEIMYEKWTEILDEVKICSDGVTVDLTPPSSGHVWIGIDTKEKYQSSTSDIFVSWESFTDVEEYKTSVHQSGIKTYQVGIGSTKGGTDIAQYTRVGLVNHYTFHGLRLQDGHEYYATVKAFDFSKRSSTADSHPVKIDSTPPQKSDQPITINGRHLSNLNEINACWRDVFYDLDSGIDHYLWAIGSQPGHGDIIPFTKTTLDCGISAQDENIAIHEGHAYFITVKAINRAKLITTASSWAYIFDMSPPVAGHVYDGNKETVVQNIKDLDYQTDLKTLSSFWEGFHDPHSIIKAYYVSIGTCPDCEDVLANQDVGITYNFTLCHMHLGSGIRYYTTITACNTADLCTSVTSDGVVIDNSPPTQGTIQDGVDDFDLEYQSLRNFISSKWYGFIDPQSGIDTYSWRVGTKPGFYDILSSQPLPLTNILVEPYLSKELPLEKRIYVTIKATNKAGLSTEATSNGFYIDETPPVIKVKPHLSKDLGSMRDDSVVFSSTIKVLWDVEDKESYVQRQYLSIASHRGGEFNATSTELNGIVREYTIPRLDLQDGGNYSIKLIVCNGARMCVEEESRGIIVDSSPPTPGMFAIRTDHAANLHRHVHGWMTWSNHKLWLSWLGFSDMHTGVEKYFVSLGSGYMMDDLNKVTESPQEFIHNQSGVNMDDEGFVQTFEVDTKTLANFEHVFVSVWAVNQVGLNSRMIHSQFKLVPGGSLELIRRCAAVTCLGHCVCAAQGQRCPLNSNQCNDVTKANPNNLLGIYDVTNIQANSPFKDVKYTSSNVGLAAKWQIVQASGMQPVWYEWSAGLTSRDEPEGIFDNLNDEVWHHAGQNNLAVIDLKKGNVLKESPVSYSVIVRAWYDENTFADFKSDGILVLSLLAKRKSAGAAVVEQNPGHWKKDIDFIKPGSPFTINWNRVFINDRNVIEKFKVYLSTYPGGHDIHVVDLDIPGTLTSYNISRVPLTPGIVLYSNVFGYSWSGIHSTVSSDGIMVDSLPPIPGTVYDGIGLHDIEYQNNSNTVSASWHGFSDKYSGITHYIWCVENVDTSHQCDVRDWENVGLHRSVSRQLNSSTLSTGSKIKNRVYAVDLIGHKSEQSESNGIVVDLTHPNTRLMEHLENNIVINPSFEESDVDAIDWNNITETNFCATLNIPKPFNWNNSLTSCVGVIKSDKNVAMAGRSFLFVDGEVSQILELKVGTLYRVTFVTAHPPLLGAVFANKEGYVNIGNKTFVFMVYTKHDKHGSKTKNIDWHHHTFYFSAHTNRIKISLGSMTGNTGILFDDVKVQQTVLHDHDDSEAHGKYIHAHVVTLHEWSSVHASWTFVDPESPIIDYMWAIGYTEGSTEVQGFKSVGLSNFAYNYNVSLPHTSIVHITVIATNAAGLSHEAHAEDLLVDLTPPDILFVNDGIGTDIGAQTSDEISANWEVNEVESGIDFCEWAVGYQEYGNEVQAFEKLPSGQNRISKVFPSSQLSLQMIHVTIRCKNNAGLQSSLSSNGVQISNLPPQTSAAELEILPLSITEYNCRGGYQGDTSKLRLKWTGFQDVTGLDSYLLSLQNHDSGIDIRKSIVAEDQDVSYCILDGLDMTAGNYTASIKAVNKMYLRSDPIANVIIVSPAVPIVTDNTQLKVSVMNRTITTWWTNHFTTQQPSFYEVSAGTTLGGADIIQWQETKNQYIEFKIPPKIKLLKDLMGYISVRAVAANGKTTLLKTLMKL